MTRKKTGILLLKKDSADSSNFALQKVKKLYQAKKAGHTGTLDVGATGVLPICSGQATKVSQLLLDSKKRYVAAMVLAWSSNTGDSYGEIVKNGSSDMLQRSAILKVINLFKGRILQTPPMFSALKQDGIPLYKLARSGIEVERQPREIEIHKISVLEVKLPRLVIEVECSKGTYIRTLVEDIAQCLDCGAYMTSLCRIGVGDYDIKQAFSVEELERVKNKSDLVGLDRLLLPPESALQSMPSIKLSHFQYNELRFGRSTLNTQKKSAGWLKLYTPDNKFFAIGENLAKGELVMRRMIITGK